MRASRFGRAVVGVVGSVAVALCLGAIFGGGCAGDGAGGRTDGAVRDAAAAGEGISFKDGGSGGNDGAPAPRDAAGDADGQGVTRDGAPAEAGRQDGPTPDIAPPDLPVPDLPPPKCALYSDWSCSKTTTFIACSTGCRDDKNVERRITCLNTGACFCIKGGTSIGQCNVPAASTCSACRAAFNKPCCSF